MKQDFSFSRRLHRREEFERVLQNKGLIDKWLVLHAEVNMAGSERLGMIISKRLVAKAVDRNRIKRVIREVFRQSTTGNVDPLLDIVVRVKKHPDDEEIMEFRRSLSRLLMKVRVKRNDAPIPFPHKGLSISD